MTLEELLAAIRAKNFTGHGIGLASSYVGTVLNAADAGGFCRQFPGKSAADFRAILKEAEGKLVFRPHGAALYSVTKGKAGGVVTAGTPMRKDAAALTPSSVMDFENVMTTRDKDRDGDVLHPKGGKLDLSMPLLWQHIPTEPIGKLVGVVEQTDDHIKTHCAIANTALGNDAAVLVEFGALRISHGFKPLKWKAMADGEEGMIQGWDVEEWEGMEISLVSVPANVGAVITAYSRSKLFAPLVKSWAGRLYEERPVVVSTAWAPVKKRAAGSVVVNVNYGDKPKKKKLAPASAAEPTAAEKAAALAAKSKKKDAPPDPDQPREKPGEETEEDNDDGPAGKAGNLLSEVAERAKTMSDDEGLSNEVRSRMLVVSGILTDVGNDINTGMEKLQACAAAQDLAGVAEAHTALIGACGKRLQRAAAELASLTEAGDDLDENAAGAVQEMAQSIGASLAGIIPADAGADQEGGTGEWVSAEEGDGTDDKDEDEEEEKDEDEDDEEDKDEDDSDLEDDDADSELEKDDDEDDDDSELDVGTDDVTDDATDRDDIDGDEEDDDEKDEDDSEVEEKDDDDDDDDDAEEKDADDDEEDEPKKRPKKKPKALNPNQLGTKLAADLMGGADMDAATKAMLRALLAD